MARVALERGWLREDWARWDAEHPDRGRGVSDLVPDHSHVSLTKTKAAGGSTGAMFAKDDAGGKWLVKEYGGNENRVATELASNAIYRAMGVHVPRAGVYPGPNGAKALAYPLEDGKSTAFSTKFGAGDEKKRRALGEHFATDALVGNHDFVGLDDDNVLWNGDQPTRLDQGGSFEYRAQGAPKEFASEPTDLSSMLLKGQGKRGVIVSKGQLRTQAAAIHKTLTPQRVDAVMDAAPFKDDKMRERVRKNLKSRVEWMGGFARGEHDLDPAVKLEESARLCGCGAPVRASGVCQRGHRVEEAWSEAARKAALLVRERKAAARKAVGLAPQERLPHGQVGGGVRDPILSRDLEDVKVAPHLIPSQELQPRLHRRIAKLGHGEATSFQGPEGPVEVTHSAQRGGVRVFHVSGGGANVDPELRRGPRNIVGRHAAATEAAERVRSSWAADAAHTRDLESQLRQHQALHPDMEFHVAAMTGELAHVTPHADGSVSVRHETPGLAESTHGSVREAVDRLKTDVRAHGGKFLDEGEKSDPLSTLPKREVEKDDVRELVRNRAGFDRVGEKMDDLLRPSSTDAWKDAVREKVASGGGLAGSATVGGSPLPEHLRDLASQHAAHVATMFGHVASVAPHAHLASHVISLVHGREQAWADLEEAQAAGNGAAIMRARARLDLVCDYLGDLIEGGLDLEALGDPSDDREVGYADAGAGVPDAVAVVECVSCGARSPAGAVTCQRGHRLSNTSVDDARRVAEFAQKARVVQEDWSTFDSARKGGVKWEKAPGGKRYEFHHAGHQLRVVKQNTAAGGPRWKAYHRAPSGVERIVGKGDDFKAVRGQAEQHFQSLGLRESTKTAALSVTHAPIGKGGTNWVTRSKPGNTGQLPAYIQNVRNAIMRDGKDESEATEIAVGRIEDWAAGKGDVHPEVRAAAAKAIAEWEAMRGASRAKSVAKS